MNEQTVSYPFGEMDVQAKDYAATIAVTVKNQKTLVNVGQLTGAATINVTPAADLRKGAELIIKLQSDATGRTASLGTSLLGAAVAGVASKTKYAYFVYDGTNFVQISVNQVD